MTKFGVRRWSVAFALASIACALGRPAPRFPAEHWERVTEAKAAGFSPQGLDQVRAKARALSTTGLVVVVGGRVLIEEGNVSETSYLASARKSVLAMLYGNYVARGSVHLDRTLAEIGIDDIGGLSDAEKQASVGDLLTSRSGVYHPASNGGDDLRDAPARGSQEHGVFFIYNNWDFNALGTIFEHETGRNIYDALETDLARPIGMEDFDRALQRKSGDATQSIHPAYHMWLSTRDMARVGYLMLRRGAWAGRQVIPASWVDAMTQPRVPPEELNPAAMRRGGLGYGYLWWVFDDAASRRGGPFAGAYTAIGAFGQYITVIPKLDLVVAHKTRHEGKRDVSFAQYRELLQLLVQAAVPR